MLSIKYCPSCNNCKFIQCFLSLCLFWNYHCLLSHTEKIWLQIFFWLQKFFPFLLFNPFAVYNQPQLSHPALNGFLPHHTQVVTPRQGTLLHGSPEPPWPCPSARMPFSFHSGSHSALGCPPTGTLALCCLMGSDILHWAAAIPTHISLSASPHGHLSYLVRHQHSAAHPLPHIDS